MSVAVFIDDPDELRWLYYCVGAAVRDRELRQRHVTPCLRSLFDKACDAMSDPGHGLQHETGCRHRESKPDVPITAREAAVTLGISSRQVRRLAADLDGQLVDGRWQFNRSAVTEYAKERSDTAA